MFNEYEPGDPIKTVISRPMVDTSGRVESYINVFPASINGRTINL